MANETATGRSNRRLTARKACLLTVRYRYKNDWHPTTAMDLSPHGCRLRVGEDLPRGQEVTVAFEAPLKDGARAAAVEVNGLVMWSRLEGLSYQAGLHFEAAPDDLLEVLGALS
jgi:PilZ domain